MMHHFGQKCPQYSPKCPQALLACLQLLAGLSSSSEDPETAGKVYISLQNKNAASRS
jgi:hypothetical protein